LALGDAAGAERDLVEALGAAADDAQRAAVLEGLLELAPRLASPDDVVEDRRRALEALGRGDSGDS
jgi:hypothetical protein